MLNFILDVFDSHNTAIKKELTTKTTEQARNEVIQLSKSFDHIILNNGKRWEVYENGEKTAWSYPNGLTGLTA